MGQEYFDLEYKCSRKRPNLDIEDILALIDVALDSKDKYWFEKLTEMKVNSAAKEDIIDNINS